MAAFSQQTNHQTVAILGAGLIGRMMAVALSAPEQGFNVTLFDKDDKTGTESAAYLAAAMLSPLAESADASMQIMQMGNHALKLWPEFLQTLAEPVFFQQQGSLILAFEQDRSYLQDFQRRLKKQSANAVQALDPQQIGALEPSLQYQSKRFTRGLFLPHEGQLDNRQLLQSLATTLQQRQVEWRSHTAIDFQASSSSMEQLQSQFHWVIDCRGLGARHDIPAALRGVRGEVIRVRAPAVDISRPVRLMHPRYPIYIAPKPNHEFVIGATQIESEDQRNPTVRSSLELLSSCFSLHSGFAEAEVLEVRSGLRPALPDNEPQIYQQGNYLSINGLFRHGYLLAPTVVEQCVALLNSDRSIASELPFYQELVTLTAPFENASSHQRGNLSALKSHLKTPFVSMENG